MCWLDASYLIALEKELLKILNDGCALKLPSDADEGVQKDDEATDSYCDASAITRDGSIAKPTVCERCASCSSITSSAAALTNAQPGFSSSLIKTFRAPAILVAIHEDDEIGQGKFRAKHDSLQTFYTVQLSVIRMQTFFRGYLVRPHAT